MLLKSPLDQLVRLKPTRSLSESLLVPEIGYRIEIGYLTLKEEYVFEYRYLSPKLALHGCFAHFASYAIEISC